MLGKPRERKIWREQKLKKFDLDSVMEAVLKKQIAFDELYYEVTICCCDLPFSVAVWDGRQDEC